MFCFKCGNKVDEGTVFCPKCGTKILADDNAKQVAASESPIPIQSQIHKVPVNTLKKKKWGKLPIIIGAVALVIVLISIVANSDKVSDFLQNQGNVTLTTTSSGSFEAVSLTETYTNDTVGNSFNYPTGWVILDSDNEFEVVEMIDSQNNADSIASFKVFSIFDQDPLGVFTKDEASVREAVNEFGTFLKLEDTLIDDVPAKGLMYQNTGLKGNDTVTNFWYLIGNDVYQITCSYSESKADIYEPIFNAIMDSYKITAASAQGESGSSLDIISYKGISIGYLLGSTDDVISLLGDSSFNDEFKLRYDDMEFYHDNGTITSLVSSDPRLIEADGITLNKNRDELIEIFGQSYEEGGEKGSYSMTYNLPDCSLHFELGEPVSEAWRITISPKATTDSASIQILY